MHLYSVLKTVAGTLCLAVLVLLLNVGCVSPWWNAFLDPTELGNFRENRVNEILRVTSFRDKPYGITEAVDPTPDDLIPVNELYKIGPSDILSISIFEFITPNFESEYIQTVDALGDIRLPQLGTIRAGGMSARDLEDKIKKLSIDAGIFPPDRDPIVTVTVSDPRQRMYQISGVIAQPASYRILRPDYYLNQAILQAGGLDQTVKTIYVFRKQKKQETAVEEDATRPDDAKTGNDQQQRVPPVMPQTMSEIAAAPGASTGEPKANPRPTTRPAKSGEPALSADQVQKDLIQAIAPGNSKPSPANEQDVSKQETTSAPETLPPFIFVEDRFVETTKPAPAVKETPEATLPPKEKAQRTPVDWEELVADQGQQRIIKIPAEKLRKGDNNYNIVIRSGDEIKLETGPYGVFYITGHILLPGFTRQHTFEFGGEDMTLRQAIASVGGLDPLAWPTRCEITRQLGDDREETTQWNLERIGAGLDPDVYLKPGDLVNIGTHPIAPLLAAIRNGIRTSYGFSFSYDRNFADIDSFGSQQNPNDRRRFDLQRRGLIP